MRCGKMNTKLTEEQIERRVERMMNSLDKQLLEHQISQEEYDAEVKSIAEWAEEQYNRN